MIFIVYLCNLLQITLLQRLKSNILWGGRIYVVSLNVQGAASWIASVAVHFFAPYSWLFGRRACALLISYLYPFSATLTKRIAALETRMIYGVMPNNEANILKNSSPIWNFNKSDFCTNNIQLVRERLSEKVHATIPKGLVGGFQFTVFQKNFKEWHERPWKYVSEC